MPTPIFQTGFEHGASTAVTGESLFTSVGGTPAISTTIVHGGTYSMRYNASGSSVYHQSSFASNTTIVGVFYVYVNAISMTSGNIRDIMEFHQGNSTKVALQVRRTSAGVYAWRWGGTNGANITIGAWTRFDFKTVVSGGVLTTDWSINGVAQTQNNPSTTLSAIDGLRWGSFMASSDAADLYWDDIILSATAGDFPIGDATVSALQPSNLDITSSVNVSNFLGPSGGVPVSGDYVYLRDLPITSGTSVEVIQQIISGTGSYIIIDNDNSSSSTIWGVTAITSLLGSSAASKYVVKAHRLDGTDIDIVNASLNITSGTPRNEKALITAPSGGWTQSELNGLTLRFGYSDDVNPAPTLAAAMIEYSHPLINTITKFHTTDSILKKTQTKSHTTDAFLQASATTKTKTHTTDAILTQSSGNYNPTQTYTTASGNVSYGGFVWRVKPGMTAAMEQAPQGVGDGSAADRQLLLNQLTRGFAGGLVTGGNAIDTVNGNVPGYTFIVDDPADSNTGGPHPTLANTWHGTLRFALQQERPFWIIFSQNMTITHGSEIAVGPNKTVDGRGKTIKIGGNQSLRYKASNWTNSTTDPNWVPGRDNTRKANLIYAYITFDDIWQDAQSSQAINWGGSQPEFDKPNGIPSKSTTTTAAYTGGATLSVTSTTGFPSPSGQVSAGNFNVSYTGVTSTSFTGCTVAPGTLTVAWPSGTVPIGTTVSTYLADFDGAGKKKTGSGDLVYVHHCDFLSISDSNFNGGYVGNNLTRNTLDWSLFGPNPDQDLFDQSGGIPFCTVDDQTDIFTSRNPATNAIVPHNLWQGQEVWLFARDGYTIPGGFAAGQANTGGHGYYVRDVTTTTFRLSTTRVGPPPVPTDGGPANDVTINPNGPMGVWVVNHDDQPPANVPSGGIGRNGDPFTSGKAMQWGVNHSVASQPLNITGDYPGTVYASMTLCNVIDTQIRAPKSNAGYIHVWNNRFYHWGPPEGGGGTCGDYDDAAQVLMERNVWIPYQLGDAHNWGNYTTNHETWTVKGTATNTAAQADSGSSAHAPLIIKHSDEPWFVASARPGYNSSNPSLSTYGSTTCVVSGSHQTTDPVWLVGGTAPYSYEKLTDFDTLNTMIATGAGNKQPWELVSSSPTVTKTHTTNAILKKTQLKTHFVDSVLKKTLTKIHTTDSILKASFEILHTVDAVLCKQTLKSHNVDAFLTTLTTKGRDHTTDAVLAQVLIQTHTTDASLFKITGLTHTVDSVLKGDVQKIHTTDAILFNLQIVSHTTDAFLKDLRWWDTDYLFRRGLKITAPQTGLPTLHPFEVIFPYANLVGNNKVRTDFGDLEVVRFNGSSWTPIPSSATKVGSNIVIAAGVVVPILSQQSSVEYYIYYGNPELTGGAPILASYTEPSYPVVVGLTDPSLSFTHPESDWKNGVAQITGATATCEFEGTQIHLLANKGNDKGIAQIQIDNEAWRDIDLFSVTSQSSVEVFVRTGLAPGMHRLRYKMSGRRNPASTGKKVNLVRIEYKKSFVIVDRGEETPEFLEWATSTGG